MRLIVITQPNILPGEAKTVTSLLRHGLDTLHLRKPAAGVAEVTRLLEEIPSDLHPRVMLHQHHELANHFNVKGLHYPERIRPKAPLHALTRSGSLGDPPQGHHLQSTSFHKLEDLEHEDPAFWGPGLSYAFLSPIFDSISKQGYAAAGFAPQRLGAALQHCRTPIIALGGISADRIGEAASMGFAGVAVLGAVWLAPDPVAALDELLHACCTCTVAKR